MQRVLIVVVGLGWLTVVSAPTDGCSLKNCVSDPREAMARSSLVVAARVVSVQSRDMRFPAGIQPVPIVRLQVLREWKGKARDEYTVSAWYGWDIDGKGRTAMLDCDVRIRVGEEYLLFSSAPSPAVADGELTPSIEPCFPVGLLKRSGWAVKLLDEAARRAK